MSIREFPSKVINRFRGASQLREPDDQASRSGALEARNVIFGPEFVATRPGIAEAFTPNTSGLAVQSFFNWVQADWNRLLMFSRNAGAPKVRQRRLDLSTESDLVTGLDADTVDAVFSAYGSRALMAFLDAGGKGEDQGRIWNSTTTGTPNVDKLFQAPLVEGGSADFTVSYSEPSSGEVDPGVHRVGMVVRTRNGYDTKPVVFAASFTATGGQNLRITLVPDSVWPAWTSTARIIMTPTSNSSLFYFVPGTDNIGFLTTAITAGSSFSVLIDVDVNDTVLAAGSEATEYFDLISQNSGGTGPWFPKFIGTYGHRVVYFVDIVDFTALGEVTVVYISEPSLPEWITADQHGITAPDRRPLVCGFAMYGTYYMLGPSSTYAVSEGLPGQVPVEWPAAQLISGQIGSPSCHGIDVDTHSGIAWVAHFSGLYTFNGGYQDRPVSYDQGAADWRRINWAAVNRVVTVVNAQAQEVRVYAPLDASNDISHALVFSYANSAGGVPTWETVDYSLWDYSLVPAIGFAGRVQNVSQPFQEVCLTSATVDPVWREKSEQAGDASLYNDAGEAIDSEWISGPTPDVLPAPVAHKGATLAVRGAGTLGVTAYTHHQTRTIPLAPITLALNPGREYLRRANAQSEALHYGVDNGNEADAWFRLSRIVASFKAWVAQR